MKIRDIWMWQKDANEYTCRFSAQKVLTSKEFREASENGSIKELTIALLMNVIAEVQEYIDMIEKEGFHV